MSPAHQHQTVVVWGAPAAGKTTVGRLIAAATGGRYLSMAELARTARRDGWLTAHEDAAGRHGVMDDAATPVLAAARAQRSRITARARRRRHRRRSAGRSRR